MHKNRLILLLGTTLTLVAGGVSFGAGTGECVIGDDAITCVEEKDLTKPVECHADFVPQDTKYSSDQNVHLGHIGNITKVWDKYQGENIRIAVIDTGIDGDHPDFYDEYGNCTIDFESARFYAHVVAQSTAGHYTISKPVNNVWPTGTDLKYFTATSQYYFNDTFYKQHAVVGHEPIVDSKAPYHGTNVAGTIAAFAHNNTDIGCVGVAPKVQIVPIKVDFYMDTIGEALQYCYELNNDDNEENDIDVVNISICGSSSHSKIGTYSTYLNNQGTIVVASAGNSNVSTPAYPAAEPNIIGVGALAEESDTSKANYSNFNDPNATSSTSTNNVEVVAPGTVYVPDYPQSYDKVSGTSFACPIIAAAAGLWKQKNPSGTFSQFRTALHNSCIDIGDSGWDTTFGYGRLCIDQLIGTEDIVDISSLSMQSSGTVAVNKTLTLNPTLNPSNTDCDDFRWWSENTSIATVSVDGVVTGLETGSTKIHVKSLTKPDDSNCKAECTVTVTSAGTDYYSPITATDSAGLSAQLQDLMFATHKKYTSYNDCKNPTYYYAMEPGSNSSSIMEFYSQSDIGKSWGAGATGTWNREHVWCQSLSGGLYGTSGAGSDLHHLRPVESTLNSTRNNSPYGVIATHNSTTEKYPKINSTTYSTHLGGWKTGDVFEPIDSVKGDVARIVMYLYTHYSTSSGGSTSSNYKGNLQLTSIMAPSTVAEAKQLLLTWHNADPVDDGEMVRNNYAASIQGNRNPYIDHPEYADIVFGTGKTISSISIETSTYRTFDFGGTFVGETIYAHYTDNTSANVTSRATFTGYDMNQAGTQIVTVSYGGKSTTYSITVGQPQVTNLKLDKYTASLDVFSSPKTTTITATVTAQTGADKTVSWSTINNDGVISLSASTGNTITVTALKEGTATVRATAGNITKDCVFTVTDSTPTYVTSIVVSGTDELTVGGTTTLTATVSPDDATTKTVTWESSDTSVATITSGGKVTAVAPGTTNITASANDESGIVSNTFVLTVKAKVTVTGMSFVDLPEELDFGSYDGTYHVKVQKDFSDGTHELIESGFGAQSKLEIDTTKLGTATVKATYTGLTTLTATVKVTNHNSSQESHTVEGSTTTTTITQKTFSGDGNTIINGETFVLDSNAQYFSYEAVRGQQIGSSGKPITKATITKRNQMGVTRVVVNASGASGTNATIKVKVGGVYFTYVGVVSASSAQAYPADASSNNAALTTTATNYEFTGDSTGDIAIEYEQSSSSAIYFKSLEVTTKTTTIDSFTGVEQAEAWANYFIERTRGTNGPCLLSNETSKVSGLKDLWDDVKYEYENMTDDGKNAFCDPTTSTLIHDCLVHYQFIVSSYGSKGPLTDFVKDSNNDAPQVVSNAHRIINEVFNDSSIMIALISVVGIAAIGVFVIYKKRKEN